MAETKPPTLEGIITRFRREAEGRASPSPVNVELEVRVQNVPYREFADIYNALVAKKGGDNLPVAAGDGVLTQVVSTIMPGSRGEGGQRQLRPARIREIHFEGGRRVREQFVQKEPLTTPLRVPSSVGLAYTVALSAERALGSSFSADEAAVIRVKSRMSFDLALTGASELRPGLRWRIDMTVARQIVGSDAGSSLKQIVDQMFAPRVTPATFLAALGLGAGADPAVVQRYRYEVEAEFMGPPEVRDLIRPSDVTAAAEVILRLASPEYVREALMQAVVFRAAQYIVKAAGYRARFQHELGLKRLLPAPLAITRADYRAIYPPRGLFLTEKADGKRALAVVHSGRGMIVADTYIDGFEPVARAGDPLYAADTILDGELVVGPNGKVNFYAFDVIAVAGADMTPDGFEKRVGRLGEAVEIMRAMGMPVSAKGFAHLSGDGPAGLAREISAVYGAEHRYPVDGLIFVSPGMSYSDTACFKWKPPEHNTIDVLARRAPSSVLGKEPFIDRPGHQLYFLFVGISRDMRDAFGLKRCPGYADLFGAEPRDGDGYAPIQFSPSDAPLAYVYQHPTDSPFGVDLDKMVIEVRCGGGCTAAGGGGGAVAWEVTRVRTDRSRELASGRYYGNDFTTAELIWLNNIYPFPIEHLWGGGEPDYFMQPKDGIYRAQTGVISFVKTQRINTLKHAGCVIDIGIGKGQDLGRYLEAGVRVLVAVDQDRAALTELVRRKHSFARKRASNRRDRPPHGTTIHVLAANANDPFGQMLGRFEAQGLAGAAADALVCNLAVHYFLADLPAMRNFVALARGAVKVGGQVILTVFVGEAVHAAFTAGGVGVGETWDIFEGADEEDPPRRKYSLKRLYSSNKLEATGQRIGVLLPFSDGRYYEEFLVNTKVLTAEFAARGFSRTASASVTESIPDFESRNRAVAGLLTEGDRKWLSLYGELVFTRDK